MSRDYLEQICPPPFRILGLRLLPLSIGRAILLQRHGCDPVIDFAGLVTAVLICSRECVDLEPTLSDPWLPVKLRLWRIRCGRFDASEKLELFHSYIRAHNTGPKIYQEDTPGTLPGAPWLQHLRVHLMSKCGWSHHDVQELPYSQALWDYYTFWENEGQAEILGDDHHEMRALANEFQARQDAATFNPQPSTLNPT